MDEDRKCALYVRVSSIAQAVDGESLDEQEERLLSYCKFKDWKNFKIYREEGRSAKDTNRPKFQEMIRDIKAGVINTVIVKKVDRLSRSISDFEATYKLFEDHDVDLVSLQENFDTSTAIGRAVIRIVLVFAQLEREQTSERTSDIMLFRAKQGLVNGGYRLLGFDTDDDKNLIPNELEVPIVKDLFDMYYQEASLAKAAKKANEKGYRTKEWTSKTERKMGGHKFKKCNLSNLLRNPVYVGKVRYDGQVFDGQHEGVVDEKLFNSVQSMIDANKQRNTSVREDKHEFLLKGLVYCGHCKKAMTPSFAYSRGNPYYYYRCLNDNGGVDEKCQVRFVGAKELEELVLREMKQLGRNEELLETVLGKVSKESKAKIKPLREKRAGTVFNVNR